MVSGYEFPDKNKPLDADERATVVRTATEGRHVESLSVLLTLFSGLMSHSAAHVVSDTVSETPYGLQLTLRPGEHECKSGGHGGPNNGWGKNNESCQHCDNGVFEFPNPRTVPIRDEAAVRVISSWFELYDSVPSKVQQRRLISHVGDRAGVPRLTPTVLRHSYGVLLAGKGFSRREIGEVMGLSESSVEGGYVPLSYGRLCEGRNPYVCGEKTNDGGRCQRSLKDDRDRCPIHDESKCGAATNQERPCPKRPSEPDNRCWMHTETE